MALAVASTSTVATSNADNLTITKPTGVASGDLLVINVGSDFDFNSPTTFPTCTGFTKGLGQSSGTTNGNPRSGEVFLWKIADSGDVAATNYTIAFAGTETLGLATMMRITGWTTGDPVFDSSSNNYASGTTTVSVTDTMIRPVAQLLIMSACSEYSTVRTATSYQITSSDSNPTWTELQDTNVNINISGASRNIVQQVAYATSSNTSNITSWGFTYSGATTATAAMLIMISTPQNVTPDIAHIAVPPTSFGVVGTNSTVATVGHIAVPPTTNGVAIKQFNPIWTNPDKGTTTWTNPDK